MVESDKHDKTSSSASVREQGNILLQCPKLTETNYTTWVLMMETILKAYGLWKVIDETDGKKETGGKQETVIDEKAENTAKGIIFQTLPQDMLMQVAQYTTTKEVWNSIKVKHLGADLVQKARLQTLRSELETLKMKLNERANEFAGKLSSIQAKFKSLGGTLKDKLLVRKLLNSVPKKFLPIMASIEQYQEIDTMQFEEAAGRITAFEERLKSQDELENNYQNKLLLASSNNQGGGRGHGRNFTKNKNSYGKDKKKDKEQEALLISEDDEPTLLMPWLKPWAKTPHENARTTPELVFLCLKPLSPAQMVRENATRRRETLYRGQTINLNSAVYGHESNEDDNNKKTNDNKKNAKKRKRKPGGGIGNETAECWKYFDPKMEQPDGPDGPWIKMAHFVKDGLKVHEKEVETIGLAVKYIKNSSQRIEKFKASTKKTCDSNRFLIAECPTRWN
nr:zinc finger, CCHC-type [Tanacetum cinerariifolium]